VRLFAVQVARDVWSSAFSAQSRCSTPVPARRRRIGHGPPGRSGFSPDHFRAEAGDLGQVSRPGARQKEPRRGYFLPGPTGPWSVRTIVAVTQTQVIADGEPEDREDQVASAFGATIYQLASSSWVISASTGNRLRAWARRNAVLGRTRLPLSAAWRVGREMLAVHHDHQASLADLRTRAGFIQWEILLLRGLTVTARVSIESSHIQIPFQRPKTNGSPLIGRDSPSRPR
jgi:hypothetical protein